MKIRQRNQILVILSQLLFLIGGGFSFLRGVSFLARPFLVKLGQDGLELKSIMLLMLFVFSMLWLGMVVGFALWVFAMKFFLSRTEVEDLISSPRVPVLTNLLKKIVNVAYKK